MAVNSCCKDDISSVVTVYFHFIIVDWDDKCDDGGCVDMWCRCRACHIVSSRHMLVSLTVSFCLH